MKSTLTSRQIANPRRTTLAHLKDAAELLTRPAGAAELPVTATEVRELPQHTANPRRTVLNEPLKTPVAP
jgi:hypothetical protein